MNGVATATATSSWTVWGCEAQLTVTDPGSIARAEHIVRAELAAVDAACSRFRPDSEVSMLAHAGGRPTSISPTLHTFLDAALTAARLTDGDVDPAVGSALVNLGYDRDFDALSQSPSNRIASALGTATVVTRADWTMVALDDGRVTIPDGLTLDLGATAKALTADRCAHAVHGELGTGVLVSLGGDIATSGPHPDNGWRIRVCDGESEPSTVVEIGSDTGVATSSTLRRRWLHEGQMLHHILNPQLARPVESYWRTVTVIASSCLTANTVSTASIVRGPSATAWLGHLGLPTRSVAADGAVIRTGGWPDDEQDRS
ncbi:ApbE family lipoprotein [Rhodococcus sp. AW25M09]|uniref:FAD:protein FMN transferase n=1 Tax=Rhodococcus sp. AW25M09 TaxID=1268303 RepID=UPI0002ABFFC2|nr:FAD:protein FMN transferase [Rhodococcus sp. AW25M09]CCQ13821.1 ApbE family lipoprotein [Rhodococcus sp. AW25M09]